MLNKKSLESFWRLKACTQLSLTSRGSVSSYREPATLPLLTILERRQVFWLSRSPARLPTPLRPKRFRGTYWAVTLTLGWILAIFASTLLDPEYTGNI